MKAPKVFLPLAAALLALLSCEARHLEAGDARIPEEDMDTVYSLEEQQQLPVLPAQPAAFPVDAERLEPYIAEAEEAVAVPHPLSKRSTVVFRPLFATRERDAERRVQHERRREYWANEERRRSAHVAAPGYRPYAGAYAPGYASVYAPAAYPALGR